MEGRKFLCLFLLQMLYLSSICDGKSCQEEKKNSGEIYYSFHLNNEKCWKIEVSNNNYARLNITYLSTYSSNCWESSVKFTNAVTGEEFTFCGEDPNRKPVIAFSDVTITYITVRGRNIEFIISYNIENFICVQKSHFRCSNHFCIHQHQVCDGVQDCENGADEKGCATKVTAVDGVNIARKNAIIWLKGQRSESFGWGKNTHRAVTALYLSGDVDFQEGNMEEELMVKQLELQTSVALLRNSTNPMSISDLSMFINALTVTCYNTRQFYGYDLLRILENRLISLKPSSPGDYLTLCNANRTFSDDHVQSLIRILQTHSEYPFYLDVQAMTITTLSCVRNKVKNFETFQNASELYNSTIQKFIDNQRKDGSFGNIYTTALVTQALLSSGQDNNKLWKLNSTVKFLMNELNTTADLLSTYLTLPIFSDRTLVDITNVNCTDYRKQDDDISEVRNKLGGKTRIQYSLYVGDNKNVIHTMYLRVAENSSAYDVMRMAQVVDYKYKFQHIDVSGHMYVYAIGGITNDPEARKFWVLYTGDSHINGTVHPQTKSPDEFILGDGEHLIMWYKTTHI